MIDVSCAFTGHRPQKYPWGYDEDAPLCVTLKQTLNLHCVLPCKGQADKWTASARELYQSVLARADSVVYISQDYRNGCMLERNRYLVDHAGTLLAIYNGEQQVERRRRYAMPIKMAGA